jgi:Tfp pilus assembly protein PilO
MASTGFLADFGRRPLGVKIGVFALIFAALVGIWYMTIFKKLQGDLDAAQSTAQGLVAQQTKLGKDEELYKELDEQQRELKQLIADNDSALPTAAQLPAFFEMLNRKVGEAGVEVRKWDYQKEIAVDDTTLKVPVDIELQGTYYQIEKFFYLLYKVSQKEGDEAGPAPTTPAPPPTVDQERDRILTVEDLHLSDPEVKNGELVMTATFRASTFRKEEQVPEPDDTAKPDKGGKKTGATNPVQKAKDKTADAMQKDADRVKEGQ